MTKTVYLVATPERWRTMPDIVSDINSKLETEISKFVLVRGDGATSLIDLSDTTKNKWLSGEYLKTNNSGIEKAMAATHLVIYSNRLAKTIKGELERHYPNLIFENISTYERT